MPGLQRRGAGDTAVPACRACDIHAAASSSPATASRALASGPPRKLDSSAANSAVACCDSFNVRSDWGLLNAVPRAATWAGGGRGVRPSASGDETCSGRRLIALAATHLALKSQEAADR